MHNTVPKKKKCIKQNAQHCNKYCVPKEKKSYSLPLIFLNIYVPTNAHLCVRIFLYINAFLYANVFAKYVKHPKTYNDKRNQRKQKQKCTKKKGKETKDIKREQSIWPFKTEKDGKDGTVLTCMTRRRKRIVDRSPGSQEKSKKI